MILYDGNVRESILDMCDTIINVSIDIQGCVNLRDMRIYREVIVIHMHDIANVSSTTYEKNVIKQDL